ncbi:peptidoglycan editing factor PgeF [Marinobacter sp. SS21]|uniref:peptidoglycan editing factor PgeF n=1 Tax=Marinobacter sp. SS21 TaxID=2979460 RepID=UPI0023312F2D|nr:peptidoglycan editing factor PgeF [Marinobacter sp. SS21]MDC0663018.1 peptidoglycan editing factor PgeF [Marinobacter sp. SS21]
MSWNNVTSELTVLLPDWPAPEWVRAGCSTRLGGVSETVWASLNLGSHVQDEAAHVQENRRRLAHWAGIGADRFYWLNQVHGTEVVHLPVNGVPDADASLTSEPGLACTVLTADCLPVLFCDQGGTRVAAAHAGWRGLCAGVLERTITALACPPERLLAWLGPAIGPAHFEVGGEVRDAFARQASEAELAFRPSPDRPGHYLANIYQLARQRLQRMGVVQVYGGNDCTVADASRFYSYRRDGVTGRMASFIWLDRR